MGKAFIVLYGISMILSLFLTKLMVHLSPKLGFMDQPEGRKDHGKPIPYGGGLGIYFSFHLVLIGTALFVFFGSLDFLPSEILIHIKGLLKREVIWQLSGILIAANLVFLLGLIDDAKGVSPRLKMLVTILAAMIVVYSGTILTAMVPFMFVNYVMTVFWIVAITHSFNLLDNMDGLSSGIALIASFILFSVSVQNGEHFIACFTVVFAGSIAGFWVLNFPPAKIFMGDAGALFIGFMMSVLTILPTFYKDSSGDSFLAIFLPVLILSIPIFDSASVVFIRWKNKKPIFVGDHNHFSHRLVYLGLSKIQAVLVIYLVAISIGISSLLLSQVSFVGSIVLLVQAIMVFIIIIILEIAGRKKNKDES